MSVWLRNQILRSVAAALLFGSAVAYAYEAETWQDSMLLVAGVLLGSSIRSE